MPFGEAGGRSNSGVIPPRAIVEFENGIRLMVDERMKWERAN